MSAFLVSKRHIDVLVGARMIIDEYDRPEPDIGADDLGLLLWRENMRSIEARYHEPIDEATLLAYKYEPPTWVPKEEDPEPNIVRLAAIVKAVCCYAYQSDEHEGWATSRAKAYCDRLRGELASIVVYRTPEYDAAPWVTS